MEVVVQIYRCEWFVIAANHKCEYQIDIVGSDRSADAALPNLTRTGDRVTVDSGVASFLEKQNDCPVVRRKAEKPPSPTI